MEPSQRSSPADLPPQIGILRPAIVYAILFGAQGAYLPYISIYLASTGLDLGTVGALIALFAAVSLVAAPWWGALADSLGDVRGPVLVASALSTVAVASLALAVGPWLIALATAFLAASFAGIIPMVDSWVVRMVGQRDRYGQARAPGSGAFVVVAFATGALIATTGARGIFLLYGPLVLLIGLSAWILLRQPGAARAGTVAGETVGGEAATVRRERGRRMRAGVSPATILGILRTPRLGLFFIASLVVWTSHAAMQGFISIRVVELGGTATAVAATWSLGAMVEVPLMYAFPALSRRFGGERLMVIGALAFAVRGLITGLATDAGVIVGASLIGGIGFSFFYVGTVSWVSSAVGRSVQATAQGVFTGTATSIGAIGGSIVGGAIGAQFGLQTLLLIAAAGYGSGAVLVWLALSRPGRVDRLPASVAAMGSGPAQAR